MIGLNPEVGRLIFLLNLELL